MGFIMGFAPGETITDALIAQRLSLTDRSTCGKGPPPPYSTVDCPLWVILLRFFPQSCKEGVSGETRDYE